MIMQTAPTFAQVDVALAPQPEAVYIQDEVPASQLPKAAKAFLQKFFPGQVIDYVVIDTDFDGDAYEISLNNGVEIDFDLAGNWEKVDCYVDPVPEGIVPTPIAHFVKANYNGAIIVKIDKEHYGYEVEFDNGIELKFAADGQLLAYDD
jgi:Protein of unknown function (DUF2874).